jgi:curved DNA-binding protein CbpA
VHTAALHRSSIEDPYRTLGLSANATDKDIKRAYRQLALK